MPNTGKKNMKKRHNFDHLSGRIGRHFGILSSIAGAKYGRITRRNKEAK